MFKKVVMVLAASFAILIFTGYLFMQFNPQFGKAPSKVDLKKFENSEHFDGKTFVNQIPTGVSGDFKTMMSSLWKYFKGTPNRQPEEGDINVLPVGVEDLENPNNETRILWFGHSTFLLQLDGKNFLFDPMLSNVPSPNPWLGGYRYNKNLPIKPEDLPELDAIFISHDHYDHLDMKSIQTLAAKSKHFYVPLGVSQHLTHWGINADLISEFDWWQNARIEETIVTFTPARHFSGRKLTGGNTSLWGGWHIKGIEHSVFFSGDSGYGSHFKEINKRLGAVDFALLECGQYNEGWADIHMMPEETVNAATDLNAQIMMPVHWAAFTLSIHAWNEPALRVTQAAKQINQAVIIPQIGEIIALDKEPTSRAAWWHSDIVENTKTLTLVNEGAKL